MTKTEINHLTMVIEEGQTTKRLLKIAISLKKEINSIVFKVSPPTIGKTDSKKLSKIAISYVQNLIQKFNIFTLKFNFVIAAIVSLVQHVC